VPPASQLALCHFEFTAPAPAGDGNFVIIDAEAVDSVQTHGYAHAMFPLAPRPTLTSLAPTVGPAAGGTLIDIRGTDFIMPMLPTSQGSRVLIGEVPLPDDMVTVISPTQITATTPSHDFGFATVRVSNGGATTAPMYFEFVSTPIVLMVFPNHGPVAGGTRVSVIGNNFRNGPTRIYIGGVDLLEQMFMDQTRIDGIIPPGADPGSVDVLASDPIGNTGTLPRGFTYDPAEPPDGGIGPIGFGGTP
jgi:hypothetical protein